MALLETLMERVGTSTVPRGIREKAGVRAFVMETGEFRRIQGLPRRDWQDYKDKWTERLRTDTGTMKLWPIQAAALTDIAQNDGAFLPIGVGQGKALVSILAAVVLDAKRPILFVPASLREQTFDHVVPAMTKHWKLPNHLVICGYSELSLEKNKDLLDEYKPDLIILDECHEVKNKRAGRTRRLTRWFNKHPMTKCVAMSGTISNRSIKDFAHIIEWCLGWGAPVPLLWNELCEWADCLDERVPDEKRVAPGALMNFCAEGENVRQGFRSRFVSAPGVVASSGDSIGNSLRIFNYGDMDMPPIIREHIENMRNTWETPNGETFSEAIELWRHVREVSLGFWYRWEPAAPKDWLEARRNWKSYVREILKTNRRGLDTELQVWNECVRMLDQPDEFVEWDGIKDDFVPNVVAEWIDNFALEAATKWLRDKGGICWVEHVAFGKRLAEFSGLPYFGGGENGIIDTPETAIIASIAAHSQGKNLQRFSRNLVVCPPTSGKVWEQLLGRTHRPGQEADEVTCAIFLHFLELLSSFEQARADARYLEDMFGNQQKLNYADMLI